MKTFTSWIFFKNCWAIAQYFSAFVLLPILLNQVLNISAFFCNILFKSTGTICGVWISDILPIFYTL